MTLLQVHSRELMPQVSALSCFLHLELPQQMVTCLEISDRGLSCIYLCTFQKWEMYFLPDLEYF
jgi:hypothetical protein